MLRSVNEGHSSSTHAKRHRNITTASWQHNRSTLARGMGAGASTNPLPETLDKTAAKERAGDQFVEAEFDAAAIEGMITGKQFEAAAAAKQPPDEAKAAGDAKKSGFSDAIKEKAKAYKETAEAGAEGWSKDKDGSPDKDPNGFYKVFKEFDTDGSGAVDAGELSKMVESLGMVLKPEELAAMIKDADEDGSGEIEFNEFVMIMLQAAAQGATTNDGQSFSALIQKKATSEPCSWKEDVIGPGITIKGASACFNGTGNAVAVLNPWMPGDKKLNKGTALFEVGVANDDANDDAPLGDLSDKTGDVWIGVVGLNFKSAGCVHAASHMSVALHVACAFAARWAALRSCAITTPPPTHFPSRLNLPLILSTCSTRVLRSEHWEKQFFAMDNTKKAIVTACRASTGEIKVNNADTGAKCCAYGKGKFKRIQVTYDQNDKSAVITVFEEKKSGEYDVKSSMQLDNVKSEVAMAVCFTSVPEKEPGVPGPTTIVKLIGSSCEKAKSRTRRSSKDMWDDDNPAGVNDTNAGGVGQAELNT